MIDLSEMVLDDDLGSDFVIVRSTGGSFVAGGWESGKPQRIPSFGPVRNAGGKELSMLPESDRPSEVLTFRTVDQIFVTNATNRQNSDILEWPPAGDQYRVLLVKNYSEQGYYLALATRMSGK